MLNSPLLLYGAGITLSLTMTFMSAIALYIIHEKDKTGYWDSDDDWWQ